MIVVKQHGARRGLFTFQCGKCGPVQQVNIEPTVVVIIEQSNTGAGNFNNGAFLGRAGAMMRLVESALVRDVLEDNRRAVDKSTGGNGAMGGVENWRMRWAE